MLHKEGMAKLTEIALEILEELKEEEESKGEKKAFYANFPLRIYEDFENNVAPTSPTKAILRFMMKVNELSKKKKS